MNESQQHQFRLEDENGDIHNVNLSQNSQHITVTIDDTDVQLSGSLDGDHLKAELNGHHFSVLVTEHEQQITIFNKQNVTRFNWQTTSDVQTDEQSDENTLTAPMNGTIVAVQVDAGASVKKDDTLIIMEAMKMEYAISAPSDGTVTAIYYQPGDLVSDGAQLVEFEPAEGDA